MDEKDVVRFRSSYVREMVAARKHRTVGEYDHGKQLVMEDDYGTEITSLGSNTSWSASWSPIPAASPPQSLSPEPGFLTSPRTTSSPSADTSASATALQVQVESLTWQLSQMEVSYKMQKMVLEQIVTFLERLQNDLTSANSDSNWRNFNSSCSKCGSQNLPTLGSARRNSLELSLRNNLESTPFNGLGHTCRPGSSFDNSPLRDIPWRRRRRDSSSNIERISSETYRLLRTVRSVLAVTTPDPTQLLTCHSDSSSVTEKATNSSQQTSLSNLSTSTSLLQNSNQHNISNGTCLSEKEEEAFRLVSEGGQRLWEGQRAWGGRQKGIRLRDQKLHEGESIQPSALPPDSYNCKVGSSSDGSHEENCMAQCTERLPEEEESGFSSLGSFQDGIKNEGVVRGSFHEVGLPDCSKSEGLTVLWV